MIMLLTGDNDFAIKADIDQRVADFIDENSQAGLEQYRAQDLELNKLADMVSGGSLFSAKRLIVIRDIGENKELAEALASKSKEVDDSTTLILVQAQPDKRTRWFKQLQPYAITHNNLRGSTLINWLRSEAKSRGLELDSTTARHLITVVGEDQWRLSSELDKLLTQSGKISTKLIDELVEPANEETIFQLIDKSVNGQSEQAIAMYERLRLGDIDPHQFIGTLSWQLNALAVVKTNHSNPTGQLASASGLSPFVIDRLRSLARKLSQQQVKSMMKLTLEADYDIKQTGIDANQRLKLLIPRLGEATS